MRYLGLIVAALIAGAIPVNAQSQNDIPPLPPSASDHATPTSSVHCSIGGSNGVVSIYTTAADCSKWIDEAKRREVVAPQPADALSEGKERVRNICASRNREACLQAIRREEVCSEYRGDAYSIYAAKLGKIPPELIVQNISRPRALAFTNEPSWIPQVADDDIERLVRAAYSREWGTPAAFANEALRRCIANYKLD